MCLYKASGKQEMVNRNASNVFGKLVVLCWGLTTGPHLWVILCRLPEKERKEIEEIVEEMKK